MKIEIILSADGRVSTTTKGTVTLEQLTYALLSTIEGAHNTALEGIPPDYKEELQEFMYDELNLAFSNLLTRFAPHLELRPNLTAEAIMEAENAILDRQPNSNQDPSKVIPITARSRTTKETGPSIS